MTSAAHATGEPLLEIRDLRTWFETPQGMLRAVNGVSLSVAEHQALGIVGESGSGKTQTFFSVFGLTHGAPGVVGGSARFAGVDLLEGLDDHVRIRPGADARQTVVKKATGSWNKTHQSRLRPILGRQVALMPQDSRRSLVPYWTVGRHLEHVLARDTSVSNSRERSETVLAQFGFHDPARVASAFPQQLSGGEAQRAMLALNMCTNPKLLVADEPTTALDALNQLRVLSELQRIHAETRLAVILISHDLAVVGCIAEHIVVLFGGRVVERAPAAVLKGESASGPVHPYTAALRESQKRRTMGLPVLQGDEAKPDVRSRGDGCPYASRCELRPTLDPSTAARCVGEFPPETRVGEDHYLSCWGMAS